MRRKKQILAVVLGSLAGTVLAVAVAVGTGSVEAGPANPKDCTQLARHEVTELFFETVHSVVWDRIRSTQ